MNSGNITGNAVFIVVPALVVFIVVPLARAVRIAPQSQTYVAERFGRFQAVMQSRFHLLIPFVGRAVTHIDLRE